MSISSGQELEHLFISRQPGEVEQNGVISSPPRPRPRSSTPLASRRRRRRLLSLPLSFSQEPRRDVLPAVGYSVVKGIVPTLVSSCKVHALRKQVSARRSRTRSQSRCIGLRLYIGLGTGLQLSYGLRRASGVGGGGVICARGGGG